MHGSAPAHPRTHHRSAQLFTMLPHRLHSSLQFLHHSSVEPQTSHVSRSGSLGTVIKDIEATPRRREPFRHENP